MGSPKKPQRLQLSRPDAANDNISLPEKRSPISSRIWQEEDPTRKSGFNGEDLSMRNFCVRVQGDHELMEGSFSFDMDGDSILGRQRDDSVDSVITLPIQGGARGEKLLQKEDWSVDVNESEPAKSEIHSNISQEESACIFPVVPGGRETMKKDINCSKNVMDCTGETSIDEAKQEILITPKNLQLNTEKEVTQEGSCSESSKVTKQPVEIPEQVSLHGRNSDLLIESSSDFKKVKLNSEVEIAKDNITPDMTHPVEALIPKNPKPPLSQTTNVPTKVPPVMESTTKQSSKSIQGPPSNNVEETDIIASSFVLANITSPFDVSKNIEPVTKIAPSMNTLVQDKENNNNHGKSEFLQGSKTHITDISSEKKIGDKETVTGLHNTKTLLTELKPSVQDASAEDERVGYRSIAVSPIVPPEGSSFTFQTGIGSQGTPQRVQYRSVAVSPIVPPGGSSSFTFQTEHSSQYPKDLKAYSTVQRTDTSSINNLTKNYSFELTPPNKDVGTETRVECKSIAVSPIIPPDGSSFTFQSLKSCSSLATGGQETHSVELLPKTYSFELTPPNQDVGIQADTRRECVSVAVSPIIPPEGSSSFVFQSEQRHQELLLSSSSDKTKEKGPCPNNIVPEDQMFTSKTQNQDVGTQAGTRVQCISVAVSPIVPPGGSSSFTFLTEKAAQGPAAEQKRPKDDKSIDNLPKTYSFELTPPNQDAAPVTRVEYKSVAVSPIIPPHESSFTFKTENNKEGLTAVTCSSMGNEGNREASNANLLPKTYSFELTPPSQEAGIQVGNKVECVSVAVSPFVFSQGSSSFTFQADGKQQELVLKHQDQTQEQVPVSSLPNTNTYKITPQNHDVGTQTDTIVPCTSIAISPIVPFEGLSSFTFQTDGFSQGSPSSICSHAIEKPIMKDAEMQVSFPTETKSVATDPMTPIGRSPQTSYPEVRVKEAKEDHPEPVREVSWDDKGMTWEVYGASMEVEVLGMAIQKHLEKQIEEHGRQKVMTPQNTRGSSVRGASVKSEGKRPPRGLRTFFHGVRRPRCCSRAGPAVE
ncbi:G protein-regulated inducer of neurite outgrowth 1 [Rhinophrynus dorsalis]